MNRYLKTLAKNEITSLDCLQDLSLECSGSFTDSLLPCFVIFINNCIKRHKAELHPAYQTLLCSTVLFADITIKFSCIYGKEKAFQILDQTGNLITGCHQPDTPCLSVKSAFQKPCGNKFSVAFTFYVGVKWALFYCITGICSFYANEAALDSVLESVPDAVLLLMLIELRFFLLPCCLR
ncbi:hypothetical protein [Dyadobacter sediminis]|uniref:Uncharacterized protein n=1 Tax=Dyadobacter sediminis TaxID=1493691 RepID=A0A5R9KHB6_9BACT|nr:hypothetical protein [Dyadobacter sediminis]TLU95450.1 hypothetical protein FEM55_07225 [Dyadobacter sediminis]